MEIPFLTIPKYAGKTIPSRSQRPATGGGHGYSWDESAAEGGYQPVFNKVRSILEEKGETLHGIARLQYDDVKGFDNKMYRIDGSARQYFLKILGDKQGNSREVYVWKVLGYGKNGRRPAQPWIGGLPAEVFAIEQLHAVLTPYYPGQLRAIRGGRYEFPLVMAMCLYLAETLAGLHRMGLLFMDLCPENVLYLEREGGGPLSFFLTDMGSVKVIADHPGEGEHWPKLVQSITWQRLTRSETRPPADLFRLNPQAKSEESPGYDFHTLGRTALILLGLATDGEGGPIEISGFGHDFDVEDPLAPRHAEVADFVALLERLLAGEPLDRAGLYSLFVRFFEERAAFAADYLDREDLKHVWRDPILQRLTRYRMALASEDRQALGERLDALMATSGAGGAAAEFDLAVDLPRHIAAGDYAAALDRLEKLAASRLIRLSKTVRYSYTFHRQALALLTRATPALEERCARLVEPGAGPNLAQIPEKETLEALRRGTIQNPGILGRTLL